MEGPTAPTPPPDPVQNIRAEIERFLREERLQPKLESLEKRRVKEKMADDDYTALRLKYEAEYAREAWLAYAAKEVRRLQEVTHPIKFSHPQAKGATSINASGSPYGTALELGTHSLKSETRLDVAIDDAKYLPIYAFLCQQLEGRSFFDMAFSGDAAFIQALSDNTTLASEWVAAFSTLRLCKGQPASHKLAKQLYWPLADGGYHLLSPLLASPMSHALYTRISRDRFSDEAKAAREARRSGKPHPEGYRDYPDLAIQSFGGSKPQNISQLNSERRGENMLLASLPPLWEPAALRPPLKTDSVFLRYYPYRREVRRLAGVLKEYLRSVAHRRSNMHMRYTRATLVAELVDEVLNMAAELRRGLEPGWTAQPDCQLRLAEQRWLDPERCALDDAFATRIRGDDWKDEICKGFANWLNSALQTDKTAFGEVEAREWAGVLKQELKLLREELADD